MEETVRSLLQNQGILEQTAVDTVDIMKAYKVNFHLTSVGHISVVNTVGLQVIVMIL